MSFSPVSHFSEHESWVIKLCIFHIIIDVLLIKMSLSHLFDKSSKARKVSLFCISSDPTSVCQSLGVLCSRCCHRCQLNPRFWDMTNPPPSAVLAWNWQIETEFSPMFPPCSKPNGEGRSSKKRFTSQKKQLKSLRGWWRIEIKH